MYNLWRALRVTFRYKLTIISSFTCAILLAVCWGGNITAVYPLVQISFQGETAQGWIEQRIDARQKQIDELKLKRSELPPLAEDETQSHESLFRRVKGWTSEIFESNKNGDEIAELSHKELTQKIDRAQNRLDWFRYFEPMIDRYVPKDQFLLVVYLMIFFAMGTLAKGVFAFCHGILSSRLGNLGSMEIRETFFNKLLAYEIDHFSQKGVTDAMSRFTGDMGNLSAGLTLVYGRLVREPLKMLVCVIGAICVSWQMFLFICIFCPVALFMIQWFAKTLRRVARNAMVEMANLYARIEETFRAIRIVKSFNRESHEREKFHQTNLAYYKKSMKIAKYGSLVNPVVETAGTTIMIFAVLVGAWLVTGQRTTVFGIPLANEPIDLGSLILFYGFLIGAIDPARRLSDFFLNIQSAAAAADRIYEMIDRELPLKEIAMPRRLEKFSDKIVFEDVSFAYNPKQPVLHHVSLEIPFGQTLAIIGPSGCGKSTLLNLLPRFYDPTGGRVLIDSIPLTEIFLTDLRNQIGIVTQESVLFNESVLENIRYGVPSASSESVVAAAKKAYADSFITNDLAEGYDTIVGPAGGLLSGGQRQRIALARAILKDPRILLLDEATSQIDIQSEEFIHDALAQLKGERTTILVTHRLSAIRLADIIVIMDEGAITAIGTHETLLKESLFYANLWATHSLEKAVRFGS